MCDFPSPSICKKQLHSSSCLTRSPNKWATCTWSAILSCLSFCTLSPRLLTPWHSDISGQTSMPSCIELKRHVAHILVPPVLHWFLHALHVHAALSILHANSLLLSANNVSGSIFSILCKNVMKFPPLAPSVVVWYSPMEAEAWVVTRTGRQAWLVGCLPYWFSCPPHSSSAPSKDFMWSPFALS